MRNTETEMRLQEIRETVLSANRRAQSYHHRRVAELTTIGMWRETPWLVTYVDRLTPDQELQ